jgi:hypothetical protein
MTDKATEQLPDFDDADAAWGAMKLPPDRTGLPMAVWITANEGWPHDLRVKISCIHSGRGAWSGAATVAARPQPREIVTGSLPVGDFALVSRWIELNRQLIIDVWDGTADAVAEVIYPRLRRLP